MKRKHVIEMTPPDFACLKAGSQAALARLLGISEPSIHFWRRSGRISKTLGTAHRKSHRCTAIRTTA
jgi:DNA-binding transcriptional regulator YdaS (Cro superfamily)